MDLSPKLTVPRIFTDAHGKSHFGKTEVQTYLKDFAPPASPMYVSDPVEARRSLFLIVPVGWYGEPHAAPRRQLMMVMGGAIEVTVSDGERRVFKAGDIALLEDTSGEGHASKNVGSESALLSVVQY